MNYCECGCGVIVSKRFVRGHHIRLFNPMKKAEVAMKISIAKKGKTYEELYGGRAGEVRRNVGLASKYRYNNREDIREILAKGRSMERTPESCKKISIRMMAYRNSLKGINRRKDFMTSDAGLIYRDKLSKKMSIIKKEHWSNPSHTYNTKQYREKISIGRMGIPSSLKGKHHTMESNMKNSIAHKLLWQNPEWARRNIMSNNWKFNRKEKELSYIIRHIAPHMYKYNGDARLGVVLGGKIPDFFNTNGKKQVIELLGEYWHGEKRTHRTKEQEVERLTSHYLKLGYKCLTIWENDLNNKVVVTQRIKEFAGV